MRKIKHIVIHCTATRSTASVAAIQNYWRDQLGWRNPGYHYLIEADGETHRLHHDNLIANGVRGHNAHSIHVAYVGGIDANGAAIDNRTLKQKSALIGQIRWLKKLYPDAVIQGHRDFANVAKDCPCFDAKLEYAEIGMPRVKNRRV